MHGPWSSAVLVLGRRETRVDLTSHSNSQRTRIFDAVMSLNEEASNESAITLEVAKDDKKTEYIVIIYHDEWRRR